MSIGTQHERTGIKIIIGFDDEYHAYRETLAATIRILRPEAEVMTVEQEKLGGVVKRFGPDIVIDGQINSERYAHLVGERGPDALLEPDAIAAQYLALHRQHRSAWTHELDLRPWSEKF